MENGKSWSAFQFQINPVNVAATSTDRFTFYGPIQIVGKVEKAKSGMQIPTYRIIRTHPSQPLSMS